MATRNFGFLGALIFGVIFTGVGYLVAYHLGKPTLDRARASEQWESVAGRIESSEVVTSRKSGSSTSGQRSRSEKMYSAEVVFAYEVGDRSYKSSTVRFDGGGSSSNSRGAYRTVNRYPPGAEVQVFYDPEQPEVAVLEPGTTFSSYLVFGIGWVFLGVGILILAGFLVQAVTAVGVLAGSLGKSRSKRPDVQEHGAVPPPPPPPA